MSKKPVLIVVFSVLYALNPIGNFLFLVFANQRPPHEVIRILGLSITKHPDPFVLCTILLWLSALVLAYGLYRVRLWAWYGFIAHSALSLLSSLYSPATGKFGFTDAFWVNSLVLIPLGFFIRKEIRKPYFNPRLRWWEQHPRLKAAIKVRLSWNEFVFDEETFDLSPDGIFVKTEKLDDVAVGYFFNLTLFFENQQPMNIQGVVVWINFVAGKIPLGYGIKFLGVQRSTRDFIGGFIADRLSTSDYLAKRNY